MKKTVLIIFCILLCIPQVGHASWSCLIKSKSAQVLLDFVNNNRQVIKNVSAWIATANNEPIEAETGILKTQQAKNNIRKWKNESISIYNDMFRFSWFYSYFDYNAVFPISNEVPYEVKRDYKLLDKENDGITQYIKKLDSKWNTDVIIKNACNWVSGTCELNGLKAKEIIWQLVKNNNDILDLYRLSVMWKAQDFDETKLILVNDNFVSEIKKHYGRDAVNACNTEEGWFFEEVSKAIDEIELMNKQWKDGIQKWKDAWQLLIGSAPSREWETEQEELQDHLFNIWVSVNNRQIMQDNLAKYNQEWLSKNNNFINNSISSIFEKTAETIKQWKNEIAWDFFEKELSNTSGDTTNNSVTHKQFKKADNNSQISKTVQERISRMYEDEVPYIAVWDTTTEQLRAKIIDTHFSVDNSIKTLEKACKLATKFCESQDKWRWNCWTCK